MAIDGPGIIESDLAFDVYNDIMDLYDSGTDIDEISKRTAEQEGDLPDDINREIFFAAALKGLWEIGCAVEGYRSRLIGLTQHEESRDTWIALGDAAFAGKRAKSVERLLAKTATQNQSPRKRKTYKKIENKFFSIGDCLVLDASGEIHHGVVCEINEYRGRLDYAVLVMERNIKSTQEAFAKARYFGRRIPCGTAGDVFSFGPHVIRLDHRMLVREGNRFVVIGNLALDKEKYGMGSFGGCLTMTDVIVDFNQTETNSRKGLQGELLPLAGILKKRSFLSIFKH